MLLEIMGLGGHLLAMGALSALVATGFGTAFFDGLKLRREMAARPRNEDNK
jgi:hypothetical protein